MNRGDSGESNLKKTLYTLSYRKNENLKASSVTLCDCVTAPVKFRCLVMFVFDLFVWLFVCRSRLSLIKIPRVIQTRSTFEGLRNRHELYQHPESPLHKETRLWTRESECKFCSSSKRK